MNIRSTGCKLTHKQLVELAVRYLIYDGYWMWLREPNTCREEPDAIGFKCGVSTLIECKATRSDFLADKNKPFRQEPKAGMGTYRYYLAPSGIIDRHELPPGWGLITALDENTLMIELHAVGFNIRNHEDEACLIYSWSYRNKRGYQNKVPRTGKKLVVMHRRHYDKETADQT